MGISLLLTPLAHAAGGFDVTLIDKGAPRAVIVVDEKAPDSVRFAGTELQNHLEKATGVKLPIVREPPSTGEKTTVIHLGENRFTRTLGLNLDGLGVDGFKIAGGDRWLAILGRDHAGKPITGLRNPWNIVEVFNPRLKIAAFGECGTLNGVYALLEKHCGMRWYLPGDLGAVIPKTGAIRVKGPDFARSPDFEYRYAWFCNFAVSDQDSVWYRRLRFGGAAPVQIIHSFDFFLKYKETHPEYFALIGGKRDFGRLSCTQGGGNLCLSNPAVLRQWIDDINAYFDKNPDHAIFPLCPNDGMEKICECPQCQAQITPEQIKTDGGAAWIGTGCKFSNYVWNFVNEVAKGVAVKHPNKQVGCFAYAGYTAPPALIKRLDPHVAVMICKARMEYPDPTYRKSIDDIVAAWRQRTGHIYIWEYYLYWHEKVGFPIPFPHLIAQDLRQLKGFSRGEFIQAESWPDGGPVTGKVDYPAMQHLNIYITSKLFWDVNADVDALLEEYYNLFYGPASAEMKSFWTAAEEVWNKKGKAKDPVNIYKRDVLEKLSSSLDQARAKTGDASVFRQRIDLVAGEFEKAKKRLGNALVLNPPSISIPGPVSGMRMDGNLRGSPWENIKPVHFVDKNGDEAKYKTLAWMAWDRHFLYVTFANYEPEISKLTARATERDQSGDPAVFMDDSVEIYLCPDPANRKKCFQFIVNPKGVIWDGCRTGTEGETNDASAMSKWNSQIEAKTKIEANRWIAEIRIPLKDLEITEPFEGKSLALNLYRNRVCGGSPIYGGWSPTLSHSHFTPERFGLVTLK